MVGAVVATKHHTFDSTIILWKYHYYTCIIDSVVQWLRTP